MGLFRDNEHYDLLEHNYDNMVKVPNRKEENKQWLLYKGGREFEFGTAENKSSWRSERDLNSGPPNYKSSAPTAQPRYLRCKRY